MSRADKTVWPSTVYSVIPLPTLQITTLWRYVNVYTLLYLFSYLDTVVLICGHNLKCKCHQFMRHAAIVRLFRLTVQMSLSSYVGVVNLQCMHLWVNESFSECSRSGSTGLWNLNPVHTSKNVEATLSNATKLNVASTIERCFDVVASVDRALGR